MCFIIIKYFINENHINIIIYLFISKYVFTFAVVQYEQQFLILNLT